MAGEKGRESEEKREYERRGMGKEKGRDDEEGREKDGRGGKWEMRKEESLKKKDNRKDG